MQNVIKQVEHGRSDIAAEHTSCLFAENVENMRQISYFEIIPCWRRGKQIGTNISFRNPFMFEKGIREDYVTVFPGNV